MLLSNYFLFESVILIFVISLTPVYIFCFLWQAEMDGVTGPMFARLKLTPNKIQDLAEGMRQVWPLTHFFLFAFCILICLVGIPLIANWEGESMLFSFFPCINFLILISDP